MKYLLIILILSFVGCSSTKKTAQEHMKAGNFLEARELWVKVLRADPKDEEAIKGKSVAEFQYLNQQVILVRNLRSAGQIESSMKTALNVKNKYSSWGKKLDVNVAKFYYQEIRKLRSNYFNILSLSIKSNKVLKADWYLNKYNGLFYSKNPKVISTYREKIKKLGKSQCHKLRKKGRNKLFWQRFSASFCKRYGVTHRFLAKNPKLMDSMFKTIKINNRVNSNDNMVKNLVDERVRKALKTSPWYHSGGRGFMSADVDGNYMYTRHSSVDTKHHPYEETVHYEEYDDVAKTEIVSYVEGGVKKERKKSYNVREKVKKSKQVSRVYGYSVTQIDQNFKAYFAAVVSKGSHKYSVSIKNEFHEADYSHSINKHEIGLYPKTAKLTIPGHWRKARLNALEQQIRGKLNKAWEEEFCAAPSTVGMDDAEQILRCSQVSESKDYPQVKTWFEKTFGISSTKVKEVIGKI